MMEENTPMPAGPTEPQGSIKAPKTINFKINKQTLIIGVAVLAILVTAALVVVNVGPGNILGWMGMGSMSRDNVAKSAVDYLNKNVLKQGQAATLEGISSESGVIKLKIKIAGSSYDSYVTRDGKLFFPQAYNVTPGGSTSETGIDAKDAKTEGRPFVGNTAAPVLMVYWFDYQCPFCKKNHQEVVDKLLDEYVNTGKVKIVFMEYAFLGPDSTTAALAEKAVWEVAPAKFWAWHEAMFAKQDDENGGWGKKSDILALTASLGIDSVKVGQLMDSKSAQYQQEISDDKAEGTRFGVDGTPAAVIGKQLISGAQPYETFKAAIETALNAK